jgi:hypothetical protein
MKALIDGDIIAYSVGFACDTVKYICRNTNAEYTTKKEADSKSSDWYIEVESEPIENCLHSVKEMINGIVTNSSSDYYAIYLSGENNYRNEVWSDYKANRAGQRKPTYLNEIREYMIKHHGAQVVNGMEADDKLGIEQCSAIRNGEPTVICTIDKDLDMIPGWHYNWRKEEMYTTEDPECLRIFFRQCLKGDAVDNIPGLFKVTGKKATKNRMAPLDEMDNFDDMWEYVDSQYEHHLMFATIAALLWIKRKEDDGKIMELLNGT